MVTNRAFVFPILALQILAESVGRRDKMSIQIRILLVLVAAMLGFSELQAGSLTIPNSFSANTPAVAADVNENFSAVKTEVDDNAAAITTVETAVGVNDARIINNEEHHAFVAVSGVAVVVRRGTACVLDRTHVDVWRFGA